MLIDELVNVRHVPLCLNLSILAFLQCLIMFYGFKILVLLHERCYMNNICLTN